jgi:hypothetical protein
MLINALPAVRANAPLRSRLSSDISSTSRSANMLPVSSTARFAGWKGMCLYAGLMTGGSWGVHMLTAPSPSAPTTEAQYREQFQSTLNSLDKAVSGYFPTDKSRQQSCNAQWDLLSQISNQIPPSDSLQRKALKETETSLARRCL